LMGCKAVRQV